MNKMNKLMNNFKARIYPADLNEIMLIEFEEYLLFMGLIKLVSDNGKLIVNNQKIKF